MVMLHFVFAFALHKCISHQTQWRRTSAHDCVSCHYIFLLLFLCTTFFARKVDESYLLHKILNVNAIGIIVLWRVSPPSSNKNGHFVILVASAKATRWPPSETVALCLLFFFLHIYKYNAKLTTKYKTHGARAAV